MRSSRHQKLLAEKTGPVASKVYPEVDKPPSLSFGGMINHLGPAANDGNFKLHS